MAEFIVSWFLTIIPLTISPGPANTMFAATGARFGLKNTLPLWFGINLVCVVISLLVGFGIGEFLFDYPIIQLVLKYLASAFMVYLAVKFFKSSKFDKREAKAPGFIDGIILQLFNFKFLFIPVIMFSQFLNPEKVIWVQVLFLTLALTIVNMAGHMVWITAGDLITRKFNSERAYKAQSYFFGILLVLVAVWMVLR